MEEAAGSIVGSAPGSPTPIVFYFYRFLVAGILHLVSFPINSERGGPGATCYLADSENCLCANE